MDEPGTPANQHDVEFPQFSTHETGFCSASTENLSECASRANCVVEAGECLPNVVNNGMSNPPPRRQPSPDMLVPFVVQSGPRVFMLASENSAWVLAELEFDTERIAFFETRRSVYEWPREAFGALLSRVALREVDDATVDEVALDFGYWLGGQFVAD
jgi:hypothetical protein